MCIKSLSEREPKSRKDGNGVDDRNLPEIERQAKDIFHIKFIDIVINSSHEERIRLLADKGKPSSKSACYREVNIKIHSSRF